MRQRTVSQTETICKSEDEFMEPNLFLFILIYCIIPEVLKVYLLKAMEIKVFQRVLSCEKYCIVHGCNQLVAVQTCYYEL